MKKSRCIKTAIIKKKVVVGSAIQKYGFIFNYLNGNETNSNDEHDMSFTAFDYLFEHVSPLHTDWGEN